MTATNSKLDLAQFEGHTRRIAYFSTDHQALAAELPAQPNLAAGVWADMREDRTALLALAREQQARIEQLEEGYPGIAHDMEKMRAQIDKLREALQELADNEYRDDDESILEKARLKARAALKASEGA